MTFLIELGKFFGDSLLHVVIAILVVYLGSKKKIPVKQVFVIFIFICIALVTLYLRRRIL